MSPPATSFLQDLQLPPDITDEACTRAISELISRASQDQPVSLNHIHDAISRYKCAAYLEPLDILPALLPRCLSQGAMDLIRTCALHNSPKEIMIVVQEAIEHLQMRLDSEENAEEDDADLVQRVIGIVALCSPALSRARLGKRSPLDLCSPLLENVTSLISSVLPLVNKEEGRALITEAAHLVRSLVVWASSVADDHEAREIKSLLRDLLDTVVVSCAPSIQAHLAIRAAENAFPRFFINSSVNKEWEDGEGAMLEVQRALESMGDSPPNTRRKPTSSSDLVYLAHTTPPAPLSATALADLHHLLVSALQMNMLVDESLFLLFRILTLETTAISPDLATSLCTVLTALASTHLDPTVRQLNLRLLSLTLTKLPPPPRLEMLLKLMTDEDFPQIRGPAVGLLKEAVLEALALPPNQATRNPFASPQLLHMFGGVLFRSRPPEFFGESKTREELAQSIELLRIADCLSFYYVLLQRDRDNWTGVRSLCNVTSVQNSLLRPLRQFLEVHIAGEGEPLMALLSLQVGLDRIDGAIRSLDLAGSALRCA